MAVPQTTTGRCRRAVPERKRERECVSVSVSPTMQHVKRRCVARALHAPLLQGRILAVRGSARARVRRGCRAGRNKEWKRVINETQGHEGAGGTEGVAGELFAGHRGGHRGAKGDIARACARNDNRTSLAVRRSHHEEAHVHVWPVRELIKKPRPLAHGMDHCKPSHTLSSVQFSSVDCCACAAHGLPTIAGGAWCAVWVGALRIA